MHVFFFFLVQLARGTQYPSSISRNTQSKKNKRRYWKTKSQWYPATLPTNLCLRAVRASRHAGRTLRERNTLCRYLMVDCSLKQRKSEAADVECTGDPWPAPPPFCFVAYTSSMLLTVVAPTWALRFVAYTPSMQTVVAPGWALRFVAYTSSMLLTFCGSALMLCVVDALFDRWADPDPWDSGRCLVSSLLYGGGGGPSSMRAAALRARSAAASLGSRAPEAFCMMASACRRSLLPMYRTPGG